MTKRNVTIKVLLILLISAMIGGAGSVFVAQQGYEELSFWIFWGTVLGAAVFANRLANKYDDQVTS